MVLQKDEKQYEPTDVVNEDDVKQEPTPELVVFIKIELSNKESIIRVCVLLFHLHSKQTCLCLLMSPHWCIGQEWPWPDSNMLLFDYNHCHLTSLYNRDT